MLCRTAIAVLGITRNNAGRTALSAVIHSASCASETPAATETTDCRSGSISRRISRINASVSHGLTASITTAASRTAAALSVVVRTPGHCAQTFERRLGTCRTNDLSGLEFSAANQSAGNGAAHVACAQNSDLHFQFVLKNNGSSETKDSASREQKQTCLHFAEAQPI